MAAVESWFAPTAAAAVAEPLPGVRPRRRPAAAAAAKPKARAKKRQRRTPRVRGSVVWMVLFAVLLAGVVALNVAVLRAHVSVNNLDQQIAHEQQVIAGLQSQYAQATAPPRIEAAAKAAGLVPASGLDTGLVNMGGRK